MQKGNPLPVFTGAKTAIISVIVTGIIPSVKKAAALIILTSLLAALTACNLLFNNEKDKTDPRQEHLRTLEYLGLNTDLGTPEDPDGNPLSEDYNPLGSQRGIFHPLEEIYFAGFAHSGRTQYLIDDYQTGLKDLYTSGSDDSWVGSQYKNCIGADMDGDGFEEIAVLYYADGTLRLKVIDNPEGNGSYGEEDLPLISEITGNLPVYPQYQPALAAGDLDGDGRDELVAGFSYFACIVDDSEADYAVTSRNYPNSRDLYIAAGNVDGDPEDEFAITYYYSGNAYCDVFDGSFSDPFPSRQAYPLVASSVGVTMQQSVHVGMGDIDGDGFDEIVFHGESTSGTEAWALIAMDDARHDFTWIEFLTWTRRTDYLWAGGFSASVAMLDYNGDTIDDIFASTAVYRYKEGGNSGHISSPTNTNIERLVNIFSDPPANVWTGDVDGDTDDPRKEEVVYLWDGKLWIGGENSLGTYAHQTPLSGSSNGYSTLCLANVDDDTPIIEYNGDHELLFTDPTVIAVLACPPYHGNCGQNIVDCGTTFGKSTAQGIEESESTGISTGFSIGYEYEDPFGVSKVSFKLTVEESLDWISSRSTEIEKYIAYNSGFDEDKVIFTAVPFDVYYYTVVSSPNPTDLGMPITINIPREMQTLSVSRSFYNANNGDYPDVGSEIFEHSIGSIESYPSPTERNALLAGDGLYSDIASVGVGSGSVTLGIVMTQGEGTGTFSDYSVTVEMEVGAGGFTSGVSAGFHYGYEYTVTNTESTTCEGTVGDIPEENFTGNGYSFGLFTYPFAPPSFEGRKFTVVNYWVE